MTIKLPHKLALWEEQLKIFPEEIALTLAPLVQKVAALIGPFPRHHAEGHVAPDGFAGLAKRGTYERLVASDWLLADELPDEFMRRSVMGEHLFWKVAYHEPFQTRSSLVLFDAGPEQLGSPRLLHIAVLAVFVARARAAKANFGWGILQSPGCDVLPGINSTEVEALLGARGSMSASADHFAAWMQQASESGFVGETWVVGSERLQQFLPRAFSALLIADVPSPGARRLRAESQPAGGHARRIELELPEPRLCAQVLRDPFSAAIAQSQKLETSAIASMVFNPQGNKLFARTQDGGIVVLPVPNSPRDIVGKPKHYETPYRLQTAGVGRIRRTTVVVSINPVSFTLNVTRFGKYHAPELGQGEYPVSVPRVSPQFRNDQLSLCVWNDVIDQKPGLYLLDHAGLLLRLFMEKYSVRRCEIVHSHVLALTRRISGMCYAAYEKSKDKVHLRIYAGGHTDPITIREMAEVPSQAFFGWGPITSLPDFGVIAVKQSEDHWFVGNRSGGALLKVPPGLTVHGVLHRDAYGYNLIVVEDDRQTLSMLGSQGTKILFKAKTPIELVCCCPQLPLIAYSTKGGRVAVYSLTFDKVLLDFARSTA